MRTIDEEKIDESINKKWRRRKEKNKREITYEEIENVIDWEKIKEDESNNIKKPKYN